MKTLFVCIATFCIKICIAQQIAADTTISAQTALNETVSKTCNSKSTIKALIIPAGLITYGFIALGKNELKQLDKSTKATINTNYIGYKTTIDNYLQFAPAVSVYALNLCGVKGKIM